MYKVQLRSTAYQLAGSVITPRPAPIFGMYAGRQSVNTAKGASHGSAEVWRFLRLRQKCPASIILAGPVASFRNVTETLAPEEQCLSGKTHRRIAAIRPAPRRRLRHRTPADPQPAPIALLHTRPGQWPRGGIRQRRPLPAGCSQWRSPSTAGSPPTLPLHDPWPPPAWPASPSPAPAAVPS